MKIQTIVNGTITMVIEPENTMEEEILKALLKQGGALHEVRTPLVVLGKTIRGSVLICSETSSEGTLIPSIERKTITEVENL
jgi:hypothetical protein